MYIRALLVFLVGLSLYYRQLLDREHWLPESARLHSSESSSDSEGSFRNGWGLRIVWRRLTQSAVNKCKGAVLFVHGYGEHSGYYADVANTLHGTLQLQGYALDHAGHGNSDGQRAYVYSVQQLAADVRSVAMRVKALHPDVPLLLYAHSMGGMVGIVAAHHSYTHDAKPLFDAVYLEAPLVRVHPTSGAWHQKLLARLVRWLPKLQIPGAKLKRHLLTRNETLMARWDRDELMARADMYVNTGNALLDGTEYIESILPDIQWPFMIATGDDDIACDYEGAIHFYNTAASKDKRLKVYPSLRHALKFEPESDKVMNDLVEWFGKFVKK